MLRIAIEHLPEWPPDAAIRYLLIAYGESGKEVLTSPFTTLDQLLTCLRLAGISLEREEEESLLRDDGAEQHSVLVASKVELRATQFGLAGADPGRRK